MITLFIIEITIIKITINENIPEATIIHITTILPEIKTTEPQIISKIPRVQLPIIFIQIEKDKTTEIHT